VVGEFGGAYGRRMVGRLYVPSRLRDKRFLGTWACRC